MRRPTRDDEAFYDVGEAGVEPAGPVTLDRRPALHGRSAGNGVARDSPILGVATGEPSSRTRERCSLLQQLSAVASVLEADEWVHSALASVLPQVLRWITELRRPARVELLNQEEPARIELASRDPITLVLRPESTDK